MVISRGKLENLTPPPLLPQIYRARIVLQKFIYIPGQKGWLFSGENSKIISPPYVPQNIAHDFLTYGLFFDGGSGNPTIILTYPPPPAK
jgi:hypothetical protein